MRRDKLPGPFLRKFDLTAWQDATADLIEDEVDQSLSDAAVLIFQKAEKIRRLLNFVTSDALNVTTKLRALVAFANHDSLVLAAKMRKMADAAVRADQNIGVAEIITAQVELPSGYSYLPNEINQSIVDSIQIPIRFVLNGKLDGDTRPEFSKVSWDDVRLDANLGLVYSLLEGLWEDCLWNDLLVRRERDGYLFEFGDASWEKRTVISRCRADNLTIQFLTISSQWLTSQPREIQQRLARVRTVEGIVRDGRHRRLVLAKSGQPSEIAVDVALLRLLGQEPYYREFIAQPVQDLEGATLDELISAWAIASSAAATLRASAEAMKVADDAPVEQWMPHYAPTLTRKSIIDAVQSGADLSRRRAEILVEFLTYRGKPKQELWTQPLVAVADGRVSPVFGAAIFPNLSRLIDRWMQQLGFDMGERGPAFERHIRDELGSAIRASRLAQIAHVIPSAVRLRPAAEREEEIDLVFTVGPVAFVGEVKCILLPAEAKQDALHRATVTGAISQIRRKVDAVKKHRGLFCAELARHSVELPEDFKLFPLVVLNGPISAGFHIDGVTTVDTNILRIFFEGQIVDLARSSDEGGLENLETRTFYASSDEGPDAALKYFEAPPQMDFVSSGLQERIVPIPPVTEGDWPGLMQTFECSLKTPEHAFEHP